MQSVSDVSLVCFLVYVRKTIETFLGICQMLDMFIVATFHMSTSPIIRTVIALEEIAVRLVVDLQVVQNCKVGLDSWSCWASTWLGCHARQVASLRVL